MTTDDALLDDMIAAGVPGDIIRRVAKVLARAELLDERRANDRERKERQKAAKAAHVNSREVTGTVGIPPHAGARAEPKITNSSSTHSEKQQKQEREGGANALLAPLQAVLNEEVAKAVVDHRKRLRKPLTPRAAKMLAKELSAFPDPIAAADQMMLRGWSSINATWDSVRLSTGPPGSLNGTTELPKWKGPHGDGSH